MKHNAFSMDAGAPVNDREKTYVESVISALALTRGMLFAVSLVASWLIASQVVYLLAWDPIRKPVSHNLAVAWTAQKESLYVRVPGASVSAADLVKIIQSAKAPSARVKAPATHAAPSRTKPRSAPVKKEPIGQKLSPSLMVPDSLYTIPFPNAGSFTAQAEYVENYLQFITTQWKSADQYRAQLLHERFEMSGGVLPADARVRPKVSVPIIGWSLPLDDVTVMGASLLAAMMLWVFFLTAQLQECIRQCKTACKEQWDEIGNYLRLQFLLLAPRSRQPHSLAYPLVFLPYIAVIFGIAIDLGYDLQWQNAMYEAVIGDKNKHWAAFLGDGGFWNSEAIGLLVVRYVVMLCMAGGLLALSTRVWKAMSDVAADLRQGQPELHLLIYVGRILIMTAVPFVLAYGWLKGRREDLAYWVGQVGYSSGPTGGGAIWTLGGLLVAVMLVVLYWRGEKWFVAKLHGESEA